MGNGKWTPPSSDEEVKIWIPPSTDVEVKDEPLKKKVTSGSQSPSLSSSSIPLTNGVQPSESSSTIPKYEYKWSDSQPLRTASIAPHPNKVTSKVGTVSQNTATAALSHPELYSKKENREQYINSLDLPAEEQKQALAQFDAHVVAAEDIKKQNELIKKEPDNPEPQLKVIENYIALGSIEQADKLSDKVIAAHPTWGPAYNYKAKIQTDNGNFAFGVDILNKGIEQNPADPTLYNNRASIKSQSGDYAGAIKDIDTGLAFTKNPHLLENMWVQKAVIFKKLLNASEKPDAEKMIEQIYDKHNPHLDQTNKEFFLEKYQEAFNEANKYASQNKEITPNYKWSGMENVMGPAPKPNAGETTSSVSQPSKEAAIEQEKVRAQAELTNKIINPDKPLTNYVLEYAKEHGEQAVGGVKQSGKGLKEGGFKGALDLFMGSANAAFGVASLTVPEVAGFNIATSATPEKLNEWAFAPATSIADAFGYEPDKESLGEKALKTADLLVPLLVLHKVGKGEAEIAKIEGVETKLKKGQKLSTEDAPIIAEALKTEATPENLEQVVKASGKVKPKKDVTKTETPVAETKAEGVSNMENKDEPTTKYEIPEKLKTETVKPEEAILVENIPVEDIKVDPALRAKIEERLKKGVKSTKGDAPISVKYNADGSLEVMDGLHRLISKKPGETINARVFNVEQSYETFKPQSKINPESKILSEAHPKENIDFAKKIIDDGWFNARGERMESRPDLRLSGVEIEKGIRDIKNDKNTVPAQKIIEKLNEIKGKGEMPMIKGTGNLVERSGINLEEFEKQKSYPKLDEKQVQEAENLKTSDIVENEGITKENFDNFAKENDWLYTPEEIQRIKKRIYGEENKTGDISASASPEGGISETGGVRKSGIHTERVPQGEHRKEFTGNSRNEEIAIELRGRIEKAHKELGKDNTRDLRQVDNKVAYDYAKEKGNWIGDFDSLGKRIPGGNEHTIVLDESNHKLYKSNNLASSSQSLDKFFNKIRLHNKLFPDTPYTFEGFAGVENIGGGRPYAEPVYSQDFVKETRDATEEEISDYMKNSGFEHVGESKFKKDGIEVWDLKPRNALKDKDGNIYIVDAEFKETKSNPKTETPTPIVSEENTQGRKIGEKTKYKRDLETSRAKAADALDRLTKRFHKGIIGDEEKPNVLEDLRIVAEHLVKEFKYKGEELLKALKDKVGEKYHFFIDENKDTIIPKETSKTTGISHEAMQREAADLGINAPERGIGTTPEEQIKRGRELLDKGADPYKIIEDFNKDKKISSDIMGVVRAEKERLRKEASKLEDSKDKEVYKVALMKLEKFNASAKPMATEWNKIGEGLQGQTDINTGSYTDLHSAFKDRIGRELSLSEEKEIKELSKKVKELTNKNEEWQKKYVEAMDKWAKETTKAESKKSITKERKEQLKQSINDRLAKLSDVKFAIENSDRTNIITEVTGLIKDIAELGGLELVDAIKLAIEKAPHLKDFIDKNKEDITNEFNKPKEQTDLHTRFEGKKDSKFDPQDVKDIWAYAKKQYIDKGRDYAETLHGVSMDLGITSKQVQDAFIQPKGTRVINDKIYRTQRARNQAINKAKYFVETANTPKWLRILQKIPSLFFEKATFGHGTVGMQTHAGMGIYNPSHWKEYFRGYVRQFKYMSPIEYEKGMENLKNDPQYIQFIRAGLDIDPDKKYSEYEKKSALGEGLGKVKEMGNRAFGSLKVFRFELAKDYYNKLSEVEKADPNTIKEVSEIINNATGVGKIEPNPVVRALVFAPRLIASRWNRLLIQPAKALYTLDKMRRGVATPAERAAAKITAKRAGEQLATMGALLAINQGLLIASGSDKRVNVTDPTKSDFFRFKFGNMTLDLSGGMVGTAQFVTRMLYLANPFGLGAEQKDLGGKTRKQAYEIAMGNYIFNTISPVASTVAEPVFRHDFNGNTVPWSDEKPLPGGHKLTWKEYLWAQAPIPAAEAAKDMYQSMQDRGMTELQINDILNGVFRGVVSGFTGARLSELSVSRKQEYQDLMKDYDSKSKSQQHVIDENLNEMDARWQQEDIQKEKDLQNEAK